MKTEIQEQDPKNPQYETNNNYQLVKTITFATETNQELSSVILTSK